MPNRDTLAPQAAVVSRATGAATFGDRYLVLADAGRVEWTADPRQATAFASMREAARMALRLPSALRAFGLLRDIEVDAHRTVH